MEAQVEETQSLFDTMIATLVTNIFDDISYALLGMQEKLEWIHVWVMDKQITHRDQRKIKEEWNNIHDPVLVKNPKTLREGACERMKVIDNA